MKATAKRMMRREVAAGHPLRRSEVLAQGLRGNTLHEMAARGIVTRIARGVYAPCEGSSSALFDYELAAKVAPRGVFTLLSALRIHGLTDENPQRMTMAIPVNRHPPKTTLPIDFVYMTPGLLETDVVERSDEGACIKVFSVERTIAECFKARNKIGVAVAVAALHEAVQKQLVDFAMLGDVLKRCRMLRVVQPYLEGLV